MNVLVLPDRPTRRCSELIAFEGRNRGPVEKVSRIQSAVAQELVSASMELVRSRARNGIDHSAGGLPVLGRIVAGQDGKLLNGVHAQVPAQHAARPAVGIVVDADAVQAIVILLGASPGDGDLVLQSRGSRGRAPQA